jgi:hypothetical protein
MQSQGLYDVFSGGIFLWGILLLYTILWDTFLGVTLQLNTPHTRTICCPF